MRPFSFLTLAASSALAVTSVEAATIDGDWLTPNGVARVHIAHCASGLCGTIIALKEPNDATAHPQVDGRNADPSLRKRPVAGLEILRGFKPSGEGRWAQGTIYNPDDGRTYASKITLEPAGGLKVEGCVVFICVAQYWTWAD